MAANFYIRCHMGLFSLDYQSDLRAQGYWSEGYTEIAVLDFEELFDKVNHDKLMTLLRMRIDDKTWLKLIRRYLRTGIVDLGLFQIRGVTGVVLLIELPYRELFVGLCPMFGSRK